MGSCINEEIERTESYLPESTKLLSIQIAEEIFPRDYQKILEDQIKIFFDDNKHEGELLCFYQMLISVIIIYRTIDHIQSNSSDTEQ